MGRHRYQVAFRHGAPFDRRGAVAIAGPPALSPPPTAADLHAGHFDVHRLLHGTGGVVAIGDGGAAVEIEPSRSLP